MTITFQSNLLNVSLRLNSFARGNVNEASNYLVSKMKEKVGKQGTGKVYGSHQASSPNDPPAKRTGMLQDSIKSTITQTRGLTKGTVFVDDPKSIYLEFGTRRMMPRPFFKRTYDEERGTIESILKGR